MAVLTLVKLLKSKYGIVSLILEMNLVRIVIGIFGFIPDR